jgi:hypothetical protein
MEVRKLECLEARKLGGQDARLAERSKLSADFAEIYYIDAV